MGRIVLGQRFKVVKPSELSHILGVSAADIVATGLSALRPTDEVREPDSDLLLISLNWGLLFPFTDCFIAFCEPHSTPTHFVEQLVKRESLVESVVIKGGVNPKFLPNFIKLVWLIGIKTNLNIYIPMEIGARSNLTKDVLRGGLSEADIYNQLISSCERQDVFSSYGNSVDWFLVNCRLLGISTLNFIGFDFNDEHIYNCHDLGIEDELLDMLLSRGKSAVTGANIKSKYEKTGEQLVKSGKYESIRFR